MVLCHRLLKLLLQFQQKVELYVGKTQILFNLGSYMALQHKRVLFIDLDYQGNLDLFFRLSDNQRSNHSIYRAFVHDANDAKASFDLKPIKVSKFISILPATDKLMDVGKIMKSKPAIADFVVLHYLASTKMKDYYDYILIDCHNSYGLTTCGALLCADYALMPVTPSMFSISGIGLTLKLFNKLKDSVVDPITSNSLISCKVKMVANMVKANTRASNQLRETVKSDPHFVALIENRELFNRAGFARENIFDYSKQEACSRAKINHRDLKIVNSRLKPAFDKIYRSVK